MRLVFISLLLAGLCLADDPQRLLTINHYVPVHSAVPAMAGELTEIYVREVVQAAGSAPAPGGVVLFVHGSGTPAEVAFDVNYQDYSWMAYLARAGFDVFAVDMTGYGRSTRPAVMNDPCNLAVAQQAAFIQPPCAPTYPHPLATIASDWNDIGAVVDHLLALKHAEKLSLIGWSQGGPRAGGYASQHPEKVNKLVLLAPAYGRGAPADPPAPLPASGIAFNTQSHSEFTVNWDRQVGCPNQFDPAASEAVWSAMLDADPVGATWGTGVRRAPLETVWGWNLEAATKLQVPALLVSGVHDKQVSPNGVRTLYADLGSTQKVFVDLACSSHNAMWEKNHLLLFHASLEWLTKGTVDGKQTGILRLGY